jgi:hypothetical protein
VNQTVKRRSEVYPSSIFNVAERVGSKMGMPACNFKSARKIQIAQSCHTGVKPGGKGGKLPKSKRDSVGP